MSIDLEAANFLRYLISQGFSASAVEVTVEKQGQTFGQHLHKDAQSWIKMKLEAEVHRYAIEDTNAAKDFSDNIADALVTYQPHIVLLRFEAPRYFAGTKPKSKESAWAYEERFAKPIALEYGQDWEQALRQKGYTVFLKWALVP